MRREDKELKDRTLIDSVIRRSQVCRLGLADGAFPYVIPMCFGYDGESLYLHCASKGRKLDILRSNSRVCFEFDIVEGLIEAPDACHWGIRYQSVIGTGVAVIVDDPQGKREALKALMAQYSRTVFAFPEDTVNGTTVIKVFIETITGKQSAR
jgi:nitroimidazol reductase NimA-like FMN-containing flavoprotein (pyridoxamine 5'-phosphate oxidase superfamily)